jgi:8-oxo-dGTP diphosphatase
MREVKEETNLDVVNVRLFSVVNSPNMGGDPNKHYVTIFMRGELSSTSPPLVNMEPHKCEGWEWVPWKDIVDKRHNTPQVLFDPMIHFIDGLPSGGLNLFE